MMKITEEMGIHKEWFEEAKKQTLETLPEFLRKLTEDYEHDYGTIVHAISAGSIATAWAMNGSKQGGITGFQAQFVMWDFIRNWQNKEGPMKLIEYDDMLYPQYRDRFEKEISEETHKRLIEKAKEKIIESPDAHPGVIKHWKNIVIGIVPFGYTVRRRNTHG